MTVLASRLRAQCVKVRYNYTSTGCNRVKERLKWKKKEKKKKKGGVGGCDILALRLRVWATCSRPALL